MLIAQMTDIHIGFDPDAKPEELNRIRFGAVLERILSSPNRPDFLVLSGDLTDHGDRESFEKTAKVLEDVDCPLLPLVGNHDSREELLRAFPETPSDGEFIHYVVESDGLRIICLDTFEPGRHGGAFCTERRDWLKLQLEAGRGRPCVIFMHHPPIVSGIDWMDPARDEQWIANFAEAVSGHETGDPRDPLRPPPPPREHAVQGNRARYHALGGAAGGARSTANRREPGRRPLAHHHRTAELRPPQMGRRQSRHPL